MRNDNPYKACKMNTRVFIYTFILASLKLSLQLGHNPHYKEPLEYWTATADDDIYDLSNDYLHIFGSRISNNETVNSNEDKSAKLRFYYTSIDNYTELPLSEAHNIFSYSWYNPNKITIFFSHGFTGHPYGPTVIFVIKALLRLTNINVILLNWQHQAAMVYPSFVNSYLNWAAPNAIKVGMEFAQTLLNLSVAGMDLKKTHLVGHSLGAHIFGVAGNKIQERGVQLPWFAITGLDPAGAGFDGKPAHLRLQPGSAHFVAIIHSDPNKYGSRKELGVVDFWPNYRIRGAVLQPGCTTGPHPRFSPEDLCNHNKSSQYFIDAFKYPKTLLGSHAKNFRTWKNYSKDERRANILEIGIYNSNAVPGNYYFTTAADSPYGLGEGGL